MEKLISNIYSLINEEPEQPIKLSKFNIKIVYYIIYFRMISLKIYVQLFNIKELNN